MTVDRLQLTNFRSYADHSLELDPVVTLVVGPNATGKTNLLEALFVLATTKSFRAKDAELIRHGEDFYRLVAHSGTNEMSLGYQSNSSGSQKKVRHDDVPTTLEKHLGTLQVVLFEPNDLLLVHGAPERRRRYLDFILTQSDKAYLKTMHRYRRVLQQRNRLLSDWHGATDELFAWNIKLTELAAEIDAKRRELIAHLNTLIPDIYARIAGSPIDIKLVYEGDVPAEDYATKFLKALEANLPRDIGAGFTTMGPHRDDFGIRFKNADITSVASRGEIRTVVLALKMAELAYIEERTGAKPLLLLDDVFSELDDSRRQFLLGTLGSYQSVITTTNADVNDELSASHATYFTTEMQKA